VWVDGVATAEVFGGLVQRFGEFSAACRWGIRCVHVVFGPVFDDFDFAVAYVVVDGADGEGEGHGEVPCSLAVVSEVGISGSGVSVEEPAVCRSELLECLASEYGDV